MENKTYRESLSSPRTQGLFVALSTLFAALFIWKWSGSGLTTGALFYAIPLLFFLFYSLNYHTLKIQISPDRLELQFGLFTWKVALSNIKRCQIDSNSLWRLGGAGIHFTWIKGKYRVFFNFLEYPRVVLRLKKKQGLVQEIAFSTRQIEKVLEFIESEIR